METEQQAPHPHGMLSIIIPAFNEGHHIHANLVQVCETLKELDFEAIVVDDGSGDNTFEESQRAVTGGLPVRAVQQTVNRGKGAALFYGFEFAKGEYIAFLDADLEIHPQYVKKFLQRLQETDADLVIGTKVPKLGQMPVLRRVMSLVYREFVSLLFGLSLRETQTGIKLFRREVLEDCIPRLRVSRFAFDVELMVAAARFGYRIVEFPVEVGFSRKSSLQRIRPRQIAGQLWDTLLIYSMASFWNWFQPGPWTKMWMLAFVLGIFLLGIGVAKLITPIILAPALKQMVYYLFLQFLPRTLRDILLVIAGGGLMLVSLNELNKSLLNAFARLDRGDLSGIFRSNKTPNRKPRDEHERQD
ncbi:MAG: glycosyltransferase family 2 protein [Chloroflexi bacterium]|nr:glycosyltransferase family 2 protein [Chloroflexota bacterium]